MSFDFIGHLYSYYVFKRSFYTANQSNAHLQDNTIHIELGILCNLTDSAHTHLIVGDGALRCLYLLSLF